MGAIPYNALTAAPTATYSDMVLADGPLFYLRGEAADGDVDLVGALPATLVGGVTHGGLSIAPGLGGSFALPGSGSTATFVSVASADAVAMSGYPIVEWWMFLDRPGGATGDGQFSWISMWAREDGGVEYTGAFAGVDGGAATDWNNSIETGFADPDNHNTAYAYADATGDLSGGPLHVVTYLDGDGNPQTIVNGAQQSVSVLTQASGPMEGSNTELYLGSGGPTVPTGYVGFDRIPGRLSDFAIYAGGNTVDVPAMALRHYNRGIA